MDLISELGPLALGSRLRRLSDRMMKEVTEIYQQSGIDFQPKWFPLFYLLTQEQRKGITEIADALQISHPAVIQLAREMEKEGWLVSEKAGNDARKRILQLTPKSVAALPKLKELWQCFRHTNAEIINEIDPHFFSMLGNMEATFTQSVYREQFYLTQHKLQHMKVEIIDFEPQYRADFKQLNIAWIVDHFAIEPHDLEQLEHPESDIIANGGRIFFAKIAEEIVGTVALVKVAESSYEMAKMAVKPTHKGLGIGEKLGRHLITIAQELGATYLFLESNQKLIPALNLYKKLGFVEVTMGQTSYARANFKAEIYF